MTFRPLRRSRLAIGLAAGALLIAGCASSDPDPGKKSNNSAADRFETGLVNIDEDAAPAQGGTLVVGEYTEARSLDPTKTYTNGAAGGSALLAIYDSLMAYDWETKTFVPRMAESLESPDKTVWTLKLRDDVTFTDGTKLDADAVIGSIEYYVSKYGYNFIQWMLNVKDVKKIDDSTVQFTTKFPWATFPNMLAHGPGVIMAPAAYANPEKFQPIGAGPFVFESYAPAESLILKANPKYFNGAPKLDKIKFVWPGGDPAKVEALNAGDVDSISLRAESEVIKLADDKTAAMQWVQGSGSGMMINEREGRPGEMMEVRAALQLAWDPVKYLERLDRDSSMATKSLFPNNSPWSTGVETVEYDLDAAKDKFKEATAKGYDGKIELIHFGDALSTNNAVAAQAMFQAAGFKVSLRAMSSVADQMKAIYLDKDFDLAVAALSIPEEDPYLRFAGTTTAISPTNVAGMDRPAMAGLVRQLAAADGPEEGLEIMTKIEELWQFDAPMLNISTAVVMQAWNDKSGGLVPTSETMMFYDQAFKTE